MEKDSVIFSAFVNYNIMLCIEVETWYGRIFLVLLCKQERFHENKQVCWKRAWVFQQNEPQNQQKIVTPVNNKVAAISKMMELPGDK